MSAQTSYGVNIASGLPGQLYGVGPKDIISRSVETTAGIGFGLAVSRGTDKDTQCILGGSDLLGFSVRSLEREGVIETGVVKYKLNDTGGILRKGYFLATCPSGCTPGNSVKYNLTTGVLDAGTATATGAIVAGVSNTGDGEAGAVTVGANAQAGAYALECVSVEAGTVTVPTTGVVAGTGNGTCTGVANGGSAKVGDYVATCVDATVSGSEIFDVVDPDGNMLDQATVDVAYSTSQIDFTINDGSTDFIVGDTVTITTTVADHDSGTFSVIAPDGSKLEDLVTDVAYLNSHFGVTIADGATDFVVGDTFTLTITADAVWANVPDAEWDTTASAGGVAVVKKN